MKTKLQTILIAIGLLFVSPIFASQFQLMVNQENASVRTMPQADSEVVAKLKKGKIIVCDGIRKNGFYHLLTKSKKDLWISDVLVDDYRPAEDDLVEGAEGEKLVPKLKSDKHDWSLDLGISSGSSNGSSFFEVNLGVNYAINDWLIYRNAPFYRSQGEASSSFGLDSSLNVIKGLELSAQVKTQFMLGSGLRVRSDSKAAPFVEAGLGLYLGPVNLDFGVKSVFNSISDPSRLNDLIFTIKAAGGLSF